MPRRRLLVLVAVYVVVLGLAAVFANQNPERSWEAAVWGSVVASFPLATFGLGGESLREQRMSSSWWFVTPRYEFLPFLACFAGGLVLFAGLRLLLAAALP